jgi:hypothetical protein
MSIEVVWVERGEFAITDFYVFTDGRPDELLGSVIPGTDREPGFYAVTGSVGVPPGSPSRDLAQAEVQRQALARLEAVVAALRSLGDKPAPDHSAAPAPTETP